MGLMRSALLAAAQNTWLKQYAPRMPFVRRTVARFMPGEMVSDAIDAAKDLEAAGLATIFTHLGENITDAGEARGVAEHYLAVLDAARAAGLGTEVSVKLTHLGLDLDAGLCHANLQRIIERAGPPSTVWLDMEASNYVDSTLEIFRRARATFPNVGVCLQAYLYRTVTDLNELLPLGPAVRLVKGAYNEPRELAYARKQDVDANYFSLAELLLGARRQDPRVRPAFATHDVALIRHIQAHALAAGLSSQDLEFQMLYGIQREEQQRLARDSWRSGVLIAYGSYWYPWFMRRLAERPANVLFVLRNLVGQ
jgi:proline dehydrogenase